MVTGTVVAFKIRPTKTRPVTVGEKNVPNEIRYSHILSRSLRLLVWYPCVDCLFPCLLAWFPCLLALTAGGVVLDPVCVALLAFISRNPEVRPVLGEKVACATVSLHLYILSYILSVVLPATPSAVHAQLWGF